MVLQAMIVNVRELCDKGAWYGKIGSQSKDAPYDWNGFLFPTITEVSIQSSNMSADMFRRVNNETLVTNTNMTLTIGTDTKTFSIPCCSEVDIDENIDNYIKVQPHTFFGLDQKEVEKRFMLAVKSILTGTWASTNGVTISSSLNKYLLSSKEAELFVERYPELLI